MAHYSWWWWAFSSKAIYFTSIINFNYSIPFSSFHNTTKWKELFSWKGTTFVYVLSSDWWISGLTPVYNSYFCTKPQILVLFQQKLITDKWFSPGIPVSSINKTDHHYITEILLKVALNTINQPLLTLALFINSEEDTATIPCLVGNIHKTLFHIYYEVKQISKWFKCNNPRRIINPGNVYTQLQWTKPSNLLLMVKRLIDFCFFIKLSFSMNA